LKAKLLVTATYDSHGAMTFSITTLSITTFSIMTLSSTGLFGTQSINDQCHYAEYQNLFNVVLSVVTLNIVMMNVVMLSVIAPQSLLYLPWSPLAA
jgi:hypothetical protein